MSAKIFGSQVLLPHVDYAGVVVKQFPYLILTLLFQNFFVTGP